MIAFSFIACNNEPVKPEEPSDVYLLENSSTGVKYIELKKAFEEVKENEELKLLKDISITTKDLPIVGKDGKVDGIGFTLKNAIFNGDGHSISISDTDLSKFGLNTGFFYLVQNATIKNCTFNFYYDYAAVAVNALENTSFDNILVTGDLEFGNNNGAIVIYAYTGDETNPITFNNCEVATNITADGTAYCAAFVGYALQSSGESSVINFKDCKMSGTLNAGIASIFIGNTSQIQKKPYTIEINNFIFGDNASVRFVTTDSIYNFNGVISASNYTNAKVKIDGTEYKYVDLVNEKTNLWGDHFKFGPTDKNLKLTRTEGKDTFTLFASENPEVVSYKVSLKIYSILKAGGTLYQGAEETIEAKNIEGASVETKLRDLKFVDQTWVNSNTDAVRGDLAGNVIYTLGEDTYYMIPDNDTATLNGKPMAIRTYTVSAFDAKGKLVSSCSLTK